MSDRLDDDAFLLILDELATPSIDYWAYCDSKKTLSNVCLASHRLRRLAQPRLFRQIWVVEQSQADALKSSAVASSLGQGTVWFTVGKRGWPGSLPGALDMAHILPNVEKLLLSGPSTARSLARIASFTKLRHLSLVYSQLGGSSMIFTAPHLEQLDIHLGAISTPDAAEWLQSVYLPALRILSVVSVETHYSGQLDLSDVLDKAMLAQLDVVQTDEHNLKVQSDLALGTAPPVLFFAPPSEAYALPRHSVHPMTHEDDDEVADAVLRLAKQAERAMSSSAKVRSRAIVLPRKVLSLSEEDGDVDYAMRRLKQACGRAVRIIWSGDECMDVLSGGVSREFVQYARELKVEQVAKGLEKTTL